MSRSERPILLGAFGDPGHAFPMIALGRALVARGHDVWLQTWQRWQEHVEAEGMSFAAAPEYGPPVGPAQLGFYEAAEQATIDTLPLVSELRPSVVVADILTLAPALAAPLRGVPWATLVPHVYPTHTRLARACHAPPPAGHFGSFQRDPCAAGWSAGAPT
jgi:UDP:flavonoid glycosyltransferase YjiC (YdhE family)